MSPLITPVETQYKLRIPSHRFRQANRDVFYFTLDLASLDGLLPERVDESMVRDANRRLMPSHAKRIQEYLAKKDDWVLGSLLLGIAPDAVEFEPYEATPGEQSNPNFGELRILSSRANTMRIFDGQHRRRAIAEILSAFSDADDEQRQQKLVSLQQASMTVVLYAEGNLITLRQMFVDASKTKRIEGNVVARFDRRDAFNLTAVRLADESGLFNGRIEMERPSVGVSSQSLLAVNQLATVLRSLELSDHGRVSRERNETYMRDLDSLFERCKVWSDEFMPASREEYQGLLTGAIQNTDIPELRAKTFAYNVTFIRVLAGCFYLWLKEGRPWEQLAQYIAKSTINRWADYGLLVDAGLVHPNGKELFARRQEVESAVRRIVQMAKTAL